MNKFLRSILLLVIIAVVAVTSAAVSNTMVFGEEYYGETNFEVSPSNPKVGDTVKITVKFFANEGMSSLQASVSYDRGILKFSSGTSATEKDGIVSIFALPEGATNKFIDLYFVVEAEGKPLISISNVKYVDMSNSLTAPKKAINGASYRITISKPTTSSSEPSSSQTPAASNNANLGSLRPSSGTLSPAFNANTTNYTVTVENDVSSIRLTATTADKSASVNGTGKVNLKKGDNKRVITVTAPDGTTKKTYTVTIHRKEDGEEEPTSSDQTTSTPDIPEGVDPYEVEIDDKTYRIQTTLTGLTPPANFTETTADYNGVQVPVYKAEGNDAVLYAIAETSGENAMLYFYEEERELFTVLKYTQIGDRLFIFPRLPDKVSAPKGFYEKQSDIGGNVVNGFAYEESVLSDFSVVYCYTDNKYGYYRYDAKEGTLQRVPDFVPKIINEKEENSVMTDADVQNGGFLQKFNSIPQKGKLVIIAGILAVVSILVLAVILVIYVINRRKETYSDETFGEDFDYDYSVDDAEPFDNVDYTEDSDDTEDEE